MVVGLLHAFLMLAAVAFADNIGWMHANFLGWLAISAWAWNIWRSSVWDWGWLIWLGWWWHINWLGWCWRIWFTNALSNSLVIGDPATKAGSRLSGIAGSGKKGKKPDRNGFHVLS